jgi:hypothetical protein
VAWKLFYAGWKPYHVDRQPFDGGWKSFYPGWKPFYADRKPYPVDRQPFDGGLEAVLYRSKATRCGLEAVRCGLEAILCPSAAVQYYLSGTVYRWPTASTIFGMRSSSVMNVVRGLATRKSHVAR